MTYKSILTALTDEDQTQSLLPQAASLANALGAHLDALCLGIDFTQMGYGYTGVSPSVLQGCVERARDTAQKLEDNATEVLKSVADKFGTSSGVLHSVDVGRRFAERARFADLVVLSKPYIDDRGPEYEALIEGALFEAAAPVLIVPDGATLTAAPQKVILAWNESKEALSAAKAALPFLKQAEQVRIVVIDPPQHGPDRSDPGGPLALMLARHGVTCEIDVLGKSMHRISEILLRHQRDVGADMIVMGAYGHSRLREAILGGATRNMLEQTTVPVLMAH